MGLSSYNDLISSVGDWSKIPQLAPLIPDFIALAEERINSDLKTEAIDVRAILITNTDDRFIKLPDDYREFRSLRILHEGKVYSTKREAPHQLVILNTPGIPYYFSITGQIEFERIPSFRFEVEMNYYARVLPLSEERQSNIILQHYPSVYLYATLGEVAKYTKDDESMMSYQAMYMSRIQEINAQERAGRVGPDPELAAFGSTP